jgi:hypothetical protein
MFNQRACLLLIVGTVGILVIVLVAEISWNALAINREPHSWFVVETQTVKGPRSSEPRVSESTIAGPFAGESDCLMWLSTQDFVQYYSKTYSCRVLTNSEGRRLWEKTSAGTF